MVKYDVTKHPRQKYEAAAIFAPGIVKVLSETRASLTFDPGIVKVLSETRAYCDIRSRNRIVKDLSV